MWLACLWNHRDTNSKVFGVEVVRKIAMVYCRPFEVDHFIVQNNVWIILLRLDITSIYVLSHVPACYESYELHIRLQPNTDDAISHVDQNRMRLHSIYIELSCRCNMLLYIYYEITKIRFFLLWERDGALQTPIDVSLNTRHPIFCCPFFVKAF